MLIYLDNNTNRKGKPNENWARELMELFTLGIGNYTETDVKEAARAFTGWTVTRDGQFVFRPALYDADPKTFMGVTGNLNGDDVLDIIFTQPAHAKFDLDLAPNPGDELAEQTLGAGADACIKKFSRAGDLVRAIEQLA